MSKNPKYHEFRAGAASADLLMTGGNEITDKQLEELNGLIQRGIDFVKETQTVAARKLEIEEAIEELLDSNKMLLEGVPDDRDSTDEEVEDASDIITANASRISILTKELKGLKVKTRPLTANMESKMEELAAKRDAPFEMGATAKSYVEEKHLRNEYGYKEIVKTDVLDKGHLNEQDGFELMDELNSLTELRSKNQKKFEDKWFKGIPDHIAIIEQIVEDIKNCFTLKTFTKAEFSRLYYGQLQVYMWLTGCRKARLCYVVTDTPDHIIKKLQKRLMWKFGGPEEIGEDAELEVQYLEAAAQIKYNHEPSKLAPTQMRCKVYQVDYDPAYIEKLKFRVEKAQEYYDTLTLVPDSLRADFLDYVSGPTEMSDRDAMAAIAGQIIESNK